MDSPKSSIGVHVRFVVRVRSICSARGVPGVHQVAERRHFPGVRIDLLLVVRLSRVDHLQ